jgi:hypothetical protein
MRTAAIVVLLAGAPALADEAPPASEPSPEQPTPEPRVDPAYGEPPERDLADGGGSYFAAPKGKDIVVTSRPDRSRKNVLGLATAAGASLVAGGVGLYFHVDSRDASRAISAPAYTGAAWTDETQATYDRAHRSALLAGVFYGIGGAALLATAIAYIATEPAQETTIIHPHVSLAPGGATVGGGWRF